MVYHKKFPQRLSKTQKRRMQRQRAVDKMRFIDVPNKTLLEGAMELEKVKEGMVPSVEKTTFGRKAIDDMESMSSADEVMDSKALLIGEIPISLNCSTVSLTLPVIFKLKKGRGRLSCHAPIPGPTRLAGTKRVRVLDFLLGLFTFFFYFFFLRAELVPVGIQKIL